MGFDESCGFCYEGSPNEHKEIPMTHHDEKLQTVVAAIRKAAEKRSGTPVRFDKGAISHFVPNPYADNSGRPKIDFSPFNELLEIDTKAMTATAEPGLSFDALVDATLPLGLMPYVVPELKTITIGGAVAGCSIESQSFRYGGFHDSCLEYEAVTGTGEVITCSPEKDQDVFHLLHGSYGTLARLTKLTFKLMPAKPFVKMEYRTHTTFDAFWADLKERCAVADYPFIDGIIHGPDKFVLCLGTMVDNAPSVSAYDRLNIYYKSTAEKTEDYMLAKDYFFRYDAECHWLTRTLPLMETKPVRWALGGMLLGSSNLIAWSGRVKSLLRLKKRPEVVVDVFIPSIRFEEFYRWYEKDFDFFPLWIVPYNMKEIYPWVEDSFAAEIGDTFMIDAAVYGKVNTDPNIDYSELLEKKVYELRGVKTLISRNHYDEDTFWKIHSKPRISGLKKRLDPENLFGDLYEKFKPENYS